MAETSDYVEWLLPYLVAGGVALLGGFVLRQRRYAPGGAWEVRGDTAILIGCLLLLALPLTFFANPTLDERVQSRLEAERRADAAALHQQRLNANREENARAREQLKKAEQDREQRLAALDLAFLGPADDPKTTSVLAKVQSRMVRLSKLKGEDSKRYRVQREEIDRETSLPIPALREKLTALSQEKQELGQHVAEYVQWYQANHRFPSPQQWPFYGPVLLLFGAHGLGWLLGRRVPVAKSTQD